MRQLPPVADRVADWLPLSCAVALVRPLFMDQWPTHVLRHTLLRLAYTGVSFWEALVLKRKRFRG